jgi:dihydrofolate synthase/folylpolyglutamate synthase
LCPLSGHKSAHVADPRRTTLRDRMTAREAEQYLLSLELFGMRFGLERMRRLLTVLGSPQEQFASVHVVGSNGKSSTVRMIAALLRGHGLRTGEYLSPHLVAFAERVRVAGKDVSGEVFAAAVAQARAAAETVNRASAGADPVTQFEAVTAAGYWELARAGVEVAVVEAGLGGRWDATNVIGSRVQVLTNVSLEHTRWLGPTIADIATEKVDVVQLGGTLVVGAGLHPDARAVAERVCAERDAQLITAPAGRGVPLLARGTFQERNFALACASAEAFLGRPLDQQAVIAAAASTLIPGRFEVVDQEPETVFDGAHNPEGVAALAESLPAFTGARPLALVISVLDDKDAAAMLRTLLPLCTHVVCCSCANPRALPAGTLASLASQLGFAGARVEPDPRAALALARDLAGPAGVALATGSLYLLADLLRPADGTAASML